MNPIELNGLWAIRAEARDELLFSLDRFLEAATPEQVAAIFGRRTTPSGPDPIPYSIQGDGVAVLRIEGPLSKRAMVDWWSGRQMGVTYDQIVAGIQAAQADPAVRAVLTAWDSPGGTVDGMQEAANEIYSIRQSGKPMEAVACGQMCSAAEGTGSAIGPVWASSDTTDLGSIGVLAVHRDFSGMEEKFGIKTTLLTAGKYKGAGFGPLDAASKAILQEGLDHSYGVFKATVARNRGISMDDVERMAEGRVFRGQNAVDVGLAKGIATVSNRVAALSKRSVTVPNRGPLAAADPNNNTKQEKNRMTKEELLAQHPALAEAFREEGRAEGIKAGATAERERIQSVMSLRRPGHEALVDGMAYDGKSSKGDVATAILSAEDRARGEQAAGLKKDTPAPVQTPSLASGGEQEEEASAQPSGREIAAKIQTLIAENAAKGVTITSQQALQLIRKGA